MAIRIILSKDELQALEKLAWHERRRVGVQAALIVRRELERAGWLASELRSAVHRHDLETVDLLLKRVDADRHADDVPAPLGSDEVSQAKTGGSA
jgi:hypothetical protein